MKKDISILLDFIYVYCEHIHGEAKKSPVLYKNLDLEKTVCLCKECSDLAIYAIDRRMDCPFIHKPPCKKCEIRCYSEDYREEIRKVMRYSGTYFIRRGRIDYLIKYFL
ncbi:nitrous oxide-stimulated promoter family protein [Geosporobacter ferrireducens]|uniref:Nitrous oxide-stimulated promoter n=1 Tax=Geosporobacter ferrireducens TaxID=1424294 RepID=A0A1D8GE06_9FIRM|nr:nitrous oxide-stimulated promoter family protein [Geosporobacter ferrireducens]AOT69149.1 hypothetical protein Gferi_05985 [Geosporobacter ferrireducens]MTI56827.1 nitrous oxide-stimulated promoter family protein [Geosporobacter ferrireducens]